MNELEIQNITLAWERERFDRIWQIEMNCMCENPMEHLKTRMDRTEDGIDYDREFDDGYEFSRTRDN